MFTLISAYFAKYKIAVYAILTIIFVGFVLYSYKYVYDKAYNTGVNETKVELDKAYEKALENKLASQKDLLQKNFDVLLTNEQQKQKVQTVYVDRVQKVKEIVQADNMKCSMTDDQISQLNTLTRTIK